MRLSSHCLVVMAAVLLIAGCVQHSTQPENLPAGPKARITVGDATAHPGDTIEIPITLDILDPDGPPWDSLSAFNLLLQYEDTSLSFVGARVGKAVSSWDLVRAEERDYRSVPGCSQVSLQGVRIWEQGSRSGSAQLLPAGVLYYLRFEIDSALQPPKNSATISFYSGGCHDNALRQSPANFEYYIQYYDASDSSFTPLSDTMRCERRYRFFPVIEFVPGQIKIDAPYGPDRADLNLNGVPFEFADAMIFADYLDRGVAALSGHPERRDRQILAGDIDGDGEPLTQADYEEMIRIGGAPFTIKIGDATVHSGDTIALPLTLTFLDKNHAWDDHFGGFDFLVSYDEDYLQFFWAERGSATEDWEYFTFRHSLPPWSGCPTNGCARALAIREMNDGVPPPPVSGWQEGTFTTLFFTAVPTELSGPIQTPVTFYSEGCNDNMLFSEDENTLFTSIGFAGDIIYVPEYDTTECTRRHHRSILNVARYVGGTVIIKK